jgi:hypothetical protein
MPYDHKNRKSDKSNWLLNLDKIQDSTMSNYYSSLPPEKDIRQYFAEAFVINKPKGRVGRDGYWLHNNGDDVYIALFSCVGEGHLAHMMIRIYMNDNKKMVEGYSSNYTGSILQFLHREVKSRFKDKNNILLNTNANMGIVKLHMPTKSMEFAGANMDLLQVTHDRVERIQGDENQVGENTENIHAYSSVKLTETESSDFYLCSSGVLNLIGGPSFKRLVLEDMGLFLKEKFSTPMYEKKKLLQEFLLNWTGSSRQNDDIMIIGFGA